MKLLDTNVVVARFREDHRDHRVVRTWWGEFVKSGERFTVPDVVWSGFVRIVTNRRAFAEPSEVAGAFEFVRAVTRHSSYRRVTPGANHLSIFEELCVGQEAAGNIVNDAALAAIAIEHGCDVVSLDRDFARFEGVRWILPRPA